MEEVIEFYYSNGSPVFLVALDASRAFDKVEYCKLFQLLIDRNMSTVFLRLVLYMYTHQKLRVKWKGICSEFFMLQMVLNRVAYCLLYYFVCILTCSLNFYDWLR